jgi:hypothetical protein
MSTKSKYRVQSNAFVVDKSKEAKKSIFLKTFAVRMGHMHSKGTSLSCAWPKRTVKMARVHHARPRRPTRVRGHLFVVCPKPGARLVVYKCSKPLHIDSARCCARCVPIMCRSARIQDSTHDQIKWWRPGCDQSQQKYSSRGRMNQLYTLYGFIIRRGLV